jgi:hypothetical protein
MVHECWVPEYCKWVAPLGQSKLLVLLRICKNVVAPTMHKCWVPEYYKWVAPLGQ